MGGIREEGEEAMGREGREKWWCGGERCEARWMHDIVAWKVGGVGGSEGRSGVDSDGTGKR